LEQLYLLIISYYWSCLAFPKTNPIIPLNIPCLKFHQMQLNIYQTHSFGWFWPNINGNNTCQKMISNLITILCSVTNVAIRLPLLKQNLVYFLKYQFFWGGWWIRNFITCLKIFYWTLYLQTENKSQIIYYPYNFHNFFSYIYLIYWFFICQVFLLQPI